MKISEVINITWFRFWNNLQRPQGNRANRLLITARYCCLSTLYQWTQINSRYGFRCCKDYFEIRVATPSYSLSKNIVFCINSLWTIFKDGGRLIPDSSTDSFPVQNITQSKASLPRQFSPENSIHTLNF